MIDVNNLNNRNEVSSGWFKNITGLRFIAAAFVIVDHTEQARSMFGLKSFWKLPGIYALGDKAVTLFFVLSGFLITFLLLKEKAVTGSISIKDFYVRRILRIWPLYYMIVILALFVLPCFSFFEWPQWTAYLHFDFNIKCILFLLILPNVNQVIYPAIPFGNQLWSIGVEEQFYLFWPLIIKHIKHAVTFLIFIIIGFPLLVSLLYYIGNSNMQIDPSLLKVINFSKQFLSLTRIDCMAIGGLAAFILFKKRIKIFQIVYHPAVQIINFLMLVYILCTGFYVPVVSNLIHGTVFSILILNLATNPKSILSLEWKPLNYLGKISYGVYMYHPFCIFLCIKTMLLLNLHLNGILAWVVLYALIFACSISLSALSYKFIEQPILKLKPLFNRTASLNKQLV